MIQKCKLFLATVERRSFRDDGAVIVERSESSKILSKSLESSFIRKTSSFRSEITSTSFGQASSILRVKVTRVLSFYRKRRLKKFSRVVGRSVPLPFCTFQQPTQRRKKPLDVGQPNPCTFHSAFQTSLIICLYFRHFESVVPRASYLI